MSLFVGAFGFLFARLNFDKMVELGNDPKLLQEPPHFGWLSNSIDGYPQTLNLKTKVRSRDIKQPPYLLISPTDHPLSTEPQGRITKQRVREIAEYSMQR